MPRFVILEHTGTPSYKPGVHWDLMLESDGKLRTWELDSVPSAEHESRAQKLPEHRLHYLNYEGPLSDDRGEVQQFDKGAYLTVKEDPHELIVDLEGRQLQGQIALRRDNGSAGGWSLTLNTAMRSRRSVG